jgi:citrate lyase subunit beta/citryl-CoA lyase
VLLAARAAGTIAIDAVYPSIDDVSGLEREAAEAASAGFDAKACIHPTQLAAVRRSFSPSPVEVADALRLLAAAADHAGGAFALQGGLVDDPIVRQARRIVERSQWRKGESLHN